MGLAWSQANQVFACSKVRQVPEMEVNSSVKDCLVCNCVIGPNVVSEVEYMGLTSLTSCKIRHPGTQNWEYWQRDLMIAIPPLVLLPSHKVSKIPSMCPCDVVSLGPGGDFNLTPTRDLPYRGCLMISLLPTPTTFNGWSSPRFPSGSVWDDHSPVVCEGNKGPPGP